MSANTPNNPDRRELLRNALNLGGVSIGAAALAACGSSPAAATRGVAVGTGVTSPDTGTGAGPTSPGTSPGTTPGGTTGTGGSTGSGGTGNTGTGTGGTGSGSGGSTGTGSGTTGPTTTSTLGKNTRIDVHCHHIPDFYRASLASKGVLTAGGIPIPPWTPQLAVNFMNEYGIQMQVVSISEPGVTHLATAPERLAMAMQLNDYTTNTLINSRDALLAGRFGGFACLPLGDTASPVDLANSSAEAMRAMNTLGMDGIGILSNYNGVYLGDPSFEPLMATLNQLGAMVFLHPVTPVKPANIVLPTFLFEFTFDTTRAVVNMLYHGVFERYPNIRWLLAHAGGTIPFLSYRTSLFTVTPALAQNLGLPQLSEAGVAAGYRKLFYDTALSPAAAAMKSVREVTSVDHVLFATDWPFSAPVFTVPGDPAPQLADTFDATERAMVERGNALAQFPRIKKLLGS